MEHDELLADDKYVMRGGVQVGSFITAELTANAVRAVNERETLIAALRWALGHVDEHSMSHEYNKARAVLERVDEEMRPTR